MSMLEQRESHKGYHFYTSYLDCPRKFYMRYVLGIRPDHEKEALLYGKAMHSAIETFNALRAKDRSLEQAKMHAKEQLVNELYSVRGSYSKTESYVYDSTRGPMVLDLWAQQTALEQETCIEFEETHEIPIGPDGIYSMTVRPDWFGKLADGRYVVRDYKTSHWSAQRTADKAEISGQLTCYIWAMSKVYPDYAGSIYGQIEALYTKGSVIDVVRSEPMIRTAYQLSAFEAGLTSIIAETSRRKAALAKGEYPAEFLFPAHKKFCELFGCEYAPLCDSNLKHYETEKDKYPIGYTRDTMEEQENE